MKKILPIALMLVCSQGYAQNLLPAGSPSQTILQEFGVGKVEINYSRPSANGRKIFGNLIPYNTMWRTGANSNTTIRFPHAVMIDGKKLDSGVYSIYTIPALDHWQVVLNKSTKNWGTTGYSDSLDVLRINVVPNRTKFYTEMLTFQFENVKPQSCELVLYWEKTRVSIPITTNISASIKANLDKASAAGKNINWPAAQYYFEYEKDNKKALQYAINATTDNPTAYWIWHYKAKIEAALGKNKDALASSNKSIELAKEAGNKDYLRLNEELQRKIRN